MSQVYKILPHYTYQDYCQWKGQWELIDGIPYAMSPAPTIKHQRISGKMYSIFRESLAGCPCEVLLPVDYKVAENTVLQPDLLIMCPPATESQCLTVSPQLVAEILSPSTALKDRNQKFYIYEAAKIPYYLMADILKNELEIYQLNTEAKYILQPPGYPFAFSFGPACRANVSFSELFQ